MTFAAERLAVIAAVTLPITALSSVMGMNVIVNDSTHWCAVGLLLTVMGVLLLFVVVVVVDLGSSAGLVVGAGRRCLAPLSVTRPSPVPVPSPSAIAS